MLPTVGRQTVRRAAHQNANRHLTPDFLTLTVFLFRTRGIFFRRTGSIRQSPKGQTVARVSELKSPQLFFTPPSSANT
eukprot:1323276-Amphidinium_carterae.1